MLHLVLNWFFPPIYNRGPSIHIQLQLWSSSGALITTRPNLGVCGRKNKMKVKVTGQGHTISVPWQRSINEALVQLGSKTWNGFCVHAACSTFTAACWGCSTHLVLNLLSFKSINTFLQEAKAIQPAPVWPGVQAMAAESRVHAALWSPASQWRTHCAQGCVRCAWNKLAFNCTCIKLCYFKQAPSRPHAHLKSSQEQRND